MTNQIKRAAALELKRWRARKAAEARAAEKRRISIDRDTRQAYLNGRLDGEISNAARYFPHFDVLIDNTMKRMCAEIARSYRPEFEAALAQFAKQIRHTPFLREVDHSPHLRGRTLRLEVTSKPRYHAIDLWGRD